jgi:TonB family protein
MTRRFATQAVVAALCMLIMANLLLASSGSYAYQNSKGGTAVDAKGVRHTAREYPNQHAPWNFADRIYAVAPDYPLQDSAKYHQGKGVFRVMIDLKTGTVALVRILRSTGYTTLDASAIASLRHWRWKRGTWKEIDLPVTFKMAPRAGTIPPPNTIHLP